MPAPAPNPVSMSVMEGAYRVLTTAKPLAKARAARRLRADWLKSGEIGDLPETLPAQPARPDKPDLVPPTEVPRRKLGSEKGRGALLHAIAHIELNAIDLAADMIARFSYDPLIAPADLPNADLPNADLPNADRPNQIRRDFIDDWSSVCDDEARHFILLHDRLEQLGMTYGDCPSHNGLWSAAMNTCENFPARLAIAPLVLEARGLDVTPNMIVKLTQARDMRSVEILEIIYNEEIGHVRIGAKWFQYVAKNLNESPKELFHFLVKTYYKGHIKPPFNVQARTLAGLSEEYYAPLAKL